MTSMGPYQPPERSHQLEYELTVRQEPKQARMCGVGGKADRRPIDPPPIVQLRVIDPSRRAANQNGQPTSHSVSPSSSPTSPTSAHSRDDAMDGQDPNSGTVSYSQTFLQNPYYFMFASLAKPDDDAELHWLKDGRTRCTTGSVVSSLYHLKDTEHNNEDAGFFVFPDLSVRTEGSYRLKLSLFEVVGNNVRHCKSIFSAPFYVYTAKKFPGMEESTALSCSLADQGIKIRIRKDIRVRKRPMISPHSNSGNGALLPHPASVLSPISDEDSTISGGRKGRKKGGREAKRIRVEDDAVTSGNADGGVGSSGGGVSGLGALPAWPTTVIEPGLAGPTVPPPGPPPPPPAPSTAGGATEQGLTANGNSNANVNGTARTTPAAATTTALGPPPYDPRGPYQQHSQQHSHPPPPPAPLQTHPPPASAPYTEPHPHAHPPQAPLPHTYPPHPTTHHVPPPQYSHPHGPPMHMHPSHAHIPHPHSHPHAYPYPPPSSQGPPGPPNAVPVPVPVPLSVPVWPPQMYDPYGHPHALAHAHHHYAPPPPPPHMQHHAPRYDYSPHGMYPAQTQPSAQGYYDQQTQPQGSVPAQTQQNQAHLSSPTQPPPAASASTTPTSAPASAYPPASPGSALAQPAPAQPPPSSHPHLQSPTPVSGNGSNNANGNGSSAVSGNTGSNNNANLAANGNVVVNDASAAPPPGGYSRGSPPRAPYHLPHPQQHLPYSQPHPQSYVAYHPPPHHQQHQRRHPHPHYVPPPQATQYPYAATTAAYPPQQQPDAWVGANGSASSNGVWGPEYANSGGTVSNVTPPGAGRAEMVGYVTNGTGSGSVSSSPGDRIQLAPLRPSAPASVSVTSPVVGTGGGGGFGMLQQLSAVRREAPYGDGVRDGHDIGRRDLSVQGERQQERGAPGGKKNVLSIGSIISDDG